MLKYADIPKEDAEALLETEVKKIAAENEHLAKRIGRTSPDKKAERAECVTNSAGK
jgi:hypothetical protein